MNNFNLESNLNCYKMISFEEYLSRNGKYKFYKLFFEDKTGNKTFSVKINKQMLYSLLTKIGENDV